MQPTTTPALESAVPSPAGRDERSTQLISRAKRVLMRKLRWDEEAAFHAMRRSSMHFREGIEVVAQRVLDGRPVTLLARVTGSKLVRRILLVAGEVRS